MIKEAAAMIAKGHVVHLGTLSGKKGSDGQAADSESVWENFGHTAPARPHQELDSSNVLGPLDHLDFKPDNLLWFRVRRLAADLVQGPNQGRFRKHESGAGWRLWSRFDSDCIGYLWKSFATKFACVRRVSHLQTEKSHRMHSRMWPRRGLNRYETRTLEALLRS